MSSFNNFNIFGDLSQDLIKNIKSFHISRHNSNQEFGYCVTNDDKVYGFGENIFKQLGYNQSNDKYVLIIELSYQNIKEFYPGCHSMFARNNQNQIFSWGWNYYGQLARDYSGYNTYLKPQISKCLNGKNIIEISCGWYHCLALTSDGLIYGWGDNRLGELGFGKEVKNTFTPKLIDLKSKIKFIQCSKYMSFAVTLEGNAYYWGSFDKTEEAVLTPKLIHLKDVSKICDYEFLSHQKYIIILNNHGQLYLINVLNQDTHQIKCQEKLTDLYCQIYQDNYCLLQSESFVYKLETDFNGTPKLIRTDLINFYDYCSHNSSPYNKTIDITKEGYLMIKEIKINQDFHPNNQVGFRAYFNKLFRLNKTDEICVLEYKNIFQSNYKDNYHEIRGIGFGLLGQVMEVKKKYTEHFYAIKKVELKDDFDFKEFQIMFKLKSEFIVKYIDSWIEGNLLFSEKIQKTLFIRMELCALNLRDFVNFFNLVNKTFDDKFEIFSYFISCQLFKELTECLVYLHSLPKPFGPIIHRNLKPENILISDAINGRFLKLCDFGLAKIQEKSKQSLMITTLEYMAPEVLNSINYNTKSDIYSLALIATEIFRFEDNIKIIRNHKNPKDFDKYLEKYLNSNLEKIFLQLLDTLSNCLLPKDYDLRPDSNQLLNNFNDFSIDKCIILNDNNITDFQILLEKHLILKNIFDTKVLNKIS